MKKLIVLGAIAACGLSTAQISQGTTYISGTLNYQGDRDNNTEYKEDKFKAVPTVGHFLADNFAIGVGVGYEGTTRERELTNGYRRNCDNGIVVEPFARKYFTLSDKLYFFGQLSVPMVFGKETREEVYHDFPADSNTTEGKFSSFGVALKPGLDYFFNKNWSVEATIGEFGYQTKKYDTEGAKSTDNINLGFNLDHVTLGVKYVFGSKKTN